MSKKRRIKFLSALFITLFSLAGAVFGSFAWFVTTVETPQYTINGESAGAYFAYGNGTAEKPFGIKIPRHLYNLAWLQYMGMFNNDPADGNKRQYYFELTDSVPEEGLDMSGFILPPIGTEDNPFVGNFNGNNKIIKNLTVTNDETAIFTSSKHPDYASVTYEAPEIVGMFGVVGNLNDAYTGTYSSSVNNIYDLGISNFTINTTTSKALVGVAAGYVDAEISNVAINDSSIDIGEASTACVNSSWTTNLSDYAAVGYCTDECKTKVKSSTNNVYGTSVSNAEITVDDSGDDGTGKGGSIKMTEIFMRLKSIVNYRGGYTDSGVIKKTVLYDKEDQNGDRAVKSSTDNTSVSKFARYHSTNYETGNYMISINSAESGRFYAPAGGHYEIATYIDDYYTHQGHLIKTIYNGIPYYLGASAQTLANQTTLTRKTSDTDALVWNIFDGASGRISTTYNGTAYYIEAYNTTSLRLTQTVGNGLTFTKATSDGKTRFTCTVGGNEYYLGYDNGDFRLIRMPTYPAYSPPAVTPDPGSWEDYLAANGVTYAAGDYQITFTLNNTKYYVNHNGANFVIETQPCSNSWVFGNLGGTGQVYNTAATRRYISQSNNNTATLVTNNAQNWTTPSGTTIKLSYEAEANCNTYTYYLKYNNTGTGLTVATGDSNNQFTIAASQTEINNYNNITVYNQWETEKNNHDTTQAAYDIYDDVTYPEAVRVYNEESLPATYCLTFEEISDSLGNTYVGPDYYLDNSLAFEGMRYDYDDTTYFPVTVIEDGEQSSANFDKYYPKDSNTGYIVCGSSYTSNQSTTDQNMALATRIRFGRWGASDIATSFANGDYVKSNGTEKIYTIDANFNYVKANDSIYENFSDTLPRFKSMLNQDASGNAYGLHFMNAQITKDAVVKAKYVKLNTSNTPFTDFELPVNSINFNLIEKGYVTLFSGMCFHNDTEENDAFASLHQVRRHPTTQKIEEIKEIVAVYSDGIEGHSYIYEYTDGKFSNGYQFNNNGAKVTLANTAYAQSMNETALPTSYYDFDTARTVNYGGGEGYQVVFDTQRITNHYYKSGGGHSAGDYVNNKVRYGQSATVDGDTVSTQTSIFYFEIPMNDGEFCIGSVQGGTGGYLFYLDIGANAKKLDRTVFVEHYKFTDNVTEFPNGVAFATISTNSTPKYEVSDGDGAFIAILANYNDECHVKRVNNGINVTEGYDAAKIKGVYKENNTITLRSGNDPPAGSDIAIVAKIYQTEVRRAQYFDYDIANHSTIRTVITGITTAEIVNGNPVNSESDVLIQQYVNNELVYDNKNDALDDISLATFYDDASGRKIADISGVSPPSAGAEGSITEKVIVVYTYNFSGDMSYDDIDIALSYVREGAATYYSATGYVITYTVGEGQSMSDIVATIQNNLPTGFTAISVSVNNTTHVITITGATIQAP